jgi:TP53 regulating kinase-like protein
MASQEARTLLKARKLGVFTPAVLHVDLEHSSLYLEKIEGQSIKAALHGGLLAADETTRVMKEIGKAVAKLHDGGIIHGDLTTSNLMLRPDGRVVRASLGSRALGPRDEKDRSETRSFAGGCRW